MPFYLRNGNLILRELHVDKIDVSTITSKTSRIIVSTFTTRLDAEAFLRNHRNLFVGEGWEVSNNLDYDYRQVSYGERR